MKQIMSAAVIVATVIGSAYAHHSFAQYYFEDRSVTVQGQLVRFDYRSPHAWVYIDAKDEEGILRHYAAEWFNPNRLARDGITTDMLKAGDNVIISGSPGRTPEEYKLHLKRLQHSDGWSWPGPRGRR